MINHDESHHWRKNTYLGHIFWDPWNGGATNLSPAVPGLAERLHSVAQQLSREPGMAQHSRALSGEVAQQMGYGMWMFFFFFF